MLPSSESLDVCRTWSNCKNRKIERTHGARGGEGGGEISSRIHPMKKGKGKWRGGMSWEERGDAEGMGGRRDK